MINDTATSYKNKPISYAFLAGQLEGILKYSLTMNPPPGIKVYDASAFNEWLKTELIKAENNARQAS